MSVKPKWIKQYCIGDLIWLQAEGFPDIPGTVVGVNKTEVLVRALMNDKDTHVAVSDAGNIKRRDRMSGLSMAGIPVGKQV